MHSFDERGPICIEENSAEVIDAHANTGTEWTQFSFQISRKSPDTTILDACGKTNKSHVKREHGGRILQESKNKRMAKLFECHKWTMKASFSRGMGKRDIIWQPDSWRLHMNVRIYILIRKNLHLNHRGLYCPISHFPAVMNSSTAVLFQPETEQTAHCGATGAFMNMIW